MAAHSTKIIENFEGSEFLREYVRDGKVKNIVILSGAGVSTSCGIPDYRSAGGVFNRIARSHELSGIVKCPSDMFTRSVIRKHPELLDHPIYTDFLKEVKDAEPSSAHNLAKYLHDLGVLKRVITQNVDGLYQKTGLPEDKILEFHGSLGKGNVVMYGDSIPKEVSKQAFVDMVECDMVIVMGTTLQVSPFCALPNVPRRSCIRVLVDLNPEVCFFNSWTPSVKIHPHDTSLRYKSFMTVKIGGKKERVSLKSMWTSSRKYKCQYIYKMTCDKWSEEYQNR